MLQLGYVMDDLVNTSGNWQRHLASISNNMPGVLMSLGAGAGLAGVLSMVYTGVVALSPVIKSTWDALIDPNAVSNEEHMARLADLTKKTASAFEQLRQAKSKSASASAGSTGELFAEAGADNLKRAVTETLTATGQAPTAQPQEYLPTPGEIAYAAATNWTTESRVKAAKDAANKRVQASLNKQLDDRAMSIITGAQSGNADARGQLSFLATQNPGAFPIDFAGNLTRTSPQSIAQQRAIDEMSKRDAAETQQAMKADAERERITKAANAERARQAAARFAEEQRKEREAAQAETSIKHEIAKSSVDARQQRIAEAVDTLGMQNRQMAGGFSQEQIVRVARTANDMFEKGLNQGQELTAALQVELERSARLGQLADMQSRAAFQMRAVQNQRQMGADHTGDFSFLPPSW
jgi:hypothetical protein